MSKGILTIHGDRAILDFGDATVADGSKIWGTLPHSVHHIKIVGPNVTHIGAWFLFGCHNLTSVNHKLLEELRNRKV